MYDDEFVVVSRVHALLHPAKGQRSSKKLTVGLLTLRNSGFRGSPYAKELRVPWLSLR